MLEIRNLTTAFIKDINLTVAPNTILGIVGDNGSGKSQFGKTVAGYYQPLNQDYQINLTKIGLLTQNPYLQFVGITVFDELSYSFEQNQFTAEQIEKALNECPFELTRTLTSLSGGEAQRLLIYKEMLAPSEVIILDETLSNVNEEDKTQIIQGLTTSNKPIILITNNIRDLQYAHMVMEIVDGRLESFTIPTFPSNYLSNEQGTNFKYQQFDYKYGLNVIVGGSGSGKTTTVTNLYYDLGHEYEIGLIPQYPYEIITVKDFAYLAPTCANIAEAINLPVEKLQQNITTLSTGELVKGLLVSIVSNKRKVLIIDEGIEVLDYQSQTKVLDFVVANFDTVIVVTHNHYLYRDYPHNLLEVK